MIRHSDWLQRIHFLTGFLCALENMSWKIKVGAVLSRLVRRVHTSAHTLFLQL